MNGDGLTAEVEAELAALEALPDVAILLDDQPEVLDWSDAERGRFFRPTKRAISIRLDSDVLAWFQSRGGRYQSRINDALREYMYAHTKAAR